MMSSPSPTMVPPTGGESTTAPVFGGQLPGAKPKAGKSPFATFLGSAALPAPGTMGTNTLLGAA